jgi:hypothetical protein
MLRTKVTHPKIDNFWMKKNIFTFGSNSFYLINYTWQSLIIFPQLFVFKMAVFDTIYNNKYILKILIGQFSACHEQNYRRKPSVNILLRCIIANCIALYYIDEKKGRSVFSVASHTWDIFFIANYTFTEVNQHKMNNN